MFLGLDLGTSAVKAVLVDGVQRVVGQASAPLTVQRPRPLWAEQDPADWWRAAEQAVGALRAADAAALAAVRGIGLSGQMHGAVLLDAGDRVLRPAILWNDGRAGAECAELERRAPRLHAIAGNLAMPGFTAPKLLWVLAHEPAHFRATARVLLPKDWLRLRLTGEHVAEMSDASGTLWLDVGARAWSSELLAATGLEVRAMPRLVEGSEASGTLRREVAEAWGLAPDVIVAGGGGDNAAGAVGVGVVRPGDAFLSLGTSGVYFVAGDRFAPAPRSAVHAFCHCLPRTWHQMSVILSAASCLSWLAAASGAGDEAALLAEAEAAAGDPRLLFLPYLSGERTPHNDPHATGAFVGLTHATSRGDLTRAVLEGVAFALADGQDALLASGTAIGTVSVIGGGARSRLWGRILASALERPLRYHAAAEIGPAFGAARLARLAVDGEEADAVCTAPAVASTVEPEPELRDALHARRRRFRELYPALTQRERTSP
ncbi:MAG TPA: xylulokinase [Candidatus Dormibacteraeota bacterium]|nr:xylulokinase [Candidatus Dormibacteraeota bacterium]